MGRLISNLLHLSNSALKLRRRQRQLRCETLEPRQMLAGDIPIVVADYYFVEEDTPLDVGTGSGLLDNDYDPLSRPMTPILVTQPQHGTIALALDGSFHYEPHENFFGNDTFSYRVNAGGTESPPANVIVSVTAVNDAPLALDDSYSIQAGSVLTIDRGRSVGATSPGESVLLPFANGNQLFYDDARDRLYSAHSGSLERYDLATNTVMSPYPLTNLSRGGDITPDASALYFADNNTATGIGYVQKLNLNDGTLQTLTYPRGASEQGGFDLAIGSGGRGLFSTGYAGSGSTPLRVINSATDVISGNNQAYQNTALTSGPGQSLIVANNNGTSEYQVFVYSGETLQNLAVRSFNTPVNGVAINRDGTLIAFVCCGGIQIRNASLQVVGMVEGFGGYAGKLAFDPLRDVLYAITNTPPGYHIAAIDTHSWQEIARIPLLNTTGSTFGQMIVSGTGEQLFVATASGVRMVNVSSLPQLLVRRKESWRYLDNGTNQGAAWRTAEFDDLSWPVGPAEFGYGEGDEATIVSYGPNPNVKLATTYFRHTFDVANPTAIEALQLGVKFDDGVAVYLNGVEVTRQNITPIAAYNHYAISPVADAIENTFREFSINPELLLPGENTLAVEVHQVSPSDTDLSFDLWLRANVAQVIGPTANDSDVESLFSSSMMIVTPPAHGTLTLQDHGRFTYVPNADFVGVDSFQYQVSDGELSSNFATVTINVEATSTIVPAVGQMNRSDVAAIALNMGRTGATRESGDVDGNGMVTLLDLWRVQTTLAPSPSGSPDAGVPVAPQAVVRAANAPSRESLTDAALTSLGGRTTLNATRKASRNRGTALIDLDSAGDVLDSAASGNETHATTLRTLCARRVR